MPAQLLHVILDHALLALEKIRNGAAEHPVADPVHGVGGSRFKAPRDLVFALGAGFESLQAMANAVLDPLIVTDLEMQWRPYRVVAPLKLIAPAIGRPAWWASITTIRSPMVRAISWKKSRDSVGMPLLRKNVER